jgi:hypothetical protein
MRDFRSEQFQKQFEQDVKAGDPKALSLLRMLKGEINAARKAMKFPPLTMPSEQGSLRE